MIQYSRLERKPKKQEIKSICSWQRECGILMDMKFILATGVYAVALAAVAETNEVPVPDEPVDSALAVSAGADFRIREEIMHNVPGLPGAPGAMMPRAYRKNINHIRFRPRVWGQLDYEQFTLYTRLTDEFREHFIENGVKRKRRSYNFPDEVVLDNLWLGATGLFDGFFDFRVGRQDMFDGRHSVLGLDRIINDGSPYVGSRCCYADMIRLTFHPTDTSKLDAFTLYDNGRNIFRYGNRNSRGRPMNAIHPGDSPEMDEWGGGLVWNDDLFERRLPYQLFIVHKHAEKYRAPSGARIPDKQVTTFGVHVTPHVTENFNFDFEGAKQFGARSNGTQAGGWMGYAAADLHKHVKSPDEFRPYTRLSAYYLSGDKHRTEGDDNDTAWDPMWARAPMDSEMFQYGTLYGLGYWSNMLYPKWTVGADFGKMHRVSAYSGPMFAAVQDHQGHADGSGQSMYKGWLTAARYDFPLRIAPKGASGLDRFTVFGHLVAEVFNPGDYFDSSRPAYFIRWEIVFKF